jgi:hypothetical protein
MSRGFNLKTDQSQIDASSDFLNKKSIRMTGWPDEVKASVNSQVGLLLPLRLLFLPHVCLVLVVNEVDNR